MGIHPSFNSRRSWESQIHPSIESKWPNRTSRSRRSMPYVPDSNVMLLTCFRAPSAAWGAGTRLLKAMRQSICQGRIANHLLRKVK